MKALFILSTTLLLVSCYSYKPMKSSKTASDEVVVAQIMTGENYTFQLVDAKEITMKVVGFENELILGQTYDYYDTEDQQHQSNALLDVSILKRDIQSVKHWKESLGKLISQVQPGKKYRFELIDGKRIKMEVVRIENELISGLIGDYNKEASIRFSDIKSIKQKKFSAGITLIYILTTILTIGAILSTVDVRLNFPSQP